MWMCASGGQTQRSHPDPLLHRRNLVPNAPLVRTLATREAVPRTMAQTVIASIPTLPPFFNPRRLPFAFPYNYLLVGLSPLFLPILLCLLLVRFSNDSKKSRIRIKDLERGRDAETEGPNRLTKLLTTVMQSAGEERVEIHVPRAEQESVEYAAADAADLAQDDKRPRVKVERFDRKGRQPLASRLRAPWSSDAATEFGTTYKPKQPSLLPAQKAMVHHLNDPALLPQLRKIWTYFPDVINCHAMIVW